MPTDKPSPATSHRLRWALALPKLGIVLLVAALLLLLWQLRSNELDEERATLIKDVLWLEQNLRFQLNGNEERLQQLANELGDASEAPRLFRSRATHLLNNHAEIAQLLWLDRHGRVIAALPGGQTAPGDSAAFGSAISQSAFEIARRLGQRHYSEPTFLAGQRAAVALLVPVFRVRQETGMLVAVYPVEALLNQLVPWWFTEKYQVVVVDENDTQLAAKTKVEGRPNQVYAIPFEPPGYGLTLRVTSYQGSGNPLQRLLGVAIVLLAIGVFWSLWAIRDLVRNRWIPKLEAHRPELILISAGFDAHREDDIAQLRLVESDYAWITEQLVQIADKYAGGRVVSTLEGGYNLSALGRSVVAHIRALSQL